jgi:hypothetical protein
MKNKEIAEVLDRIADLLEVQEANPFRIGAYRDAANQVRSMDRSVADIVREGPQESLEALPNIGSSLAGVITELVHQGRSSMLERLQSDVAPERIFEQVPGIGEELSERIVRHLDVSTLEELEQAAHDGRLSDVPGFGEERVRSVRVSLAGLLSRAAQRHARRVETDQDEVAKRPRVGLLLEIDRIYRERAEAGELRKIVPKRFNPDDEAWLPIIEEDRGDWHFTALYSNTAQAHRLNKTHDWVVIYYKRDGKEGQATVVTESQGPLEGKRVIRGREAECLDYYKSKSA